MASRGTRDEKKAARWRRLIAEQRNSGMTIAAFCRKTGVAVGQFHWWNRRLRESGKDHASAGFVELVSRPEEISSSGVELQVDGRVSVRLARGFDPETLKVVLATLAAEAG